MIRRQRGEREGGGRDKECGGRWHKAWRCLRWLVFSIPTMLAMERAEDRKTRQVSTKTALPRVQTHTHTETWRDQRPDLSEQMSHRCSPPSNHAVLMSMLLPLLPHPTCIFFSLDCLFHTDCLSLSPLCFRTLLPLVRDSLAHRRHTSSRRRAPEPGMRVPAHTLLLPCALS